MNKTAIIRCEHFNAAHRLHNKNWSDEKNHAIFGKCNNPNYHGHNYDLEVRITDDVQNNHICGNRPLEELTSNQSTC